MSRTKYNIGLNNKYYCAFKYLDIFVWYFYLPNICTVHIDIISYTTDSILCVCLPWLNLIKNVCINLNINFTTVSNWFSG